MKPGVPYVPKPASDTVRFGWACALATFTLLVLRVAFDADTPDVRASIYCAVAGMSGITAIYQAIRLAQTVEKES